MDPQIERASGDSERRSAALSRARTVAELLDESVRLPGTQFRFGLDPVFGLVPVLGDSVALLGSLYVVLTAVYLGVPLRAVAVMLLLVGFDWIVGSVPVVGSAIDAALKVNVRNVERLERHVERSSGATSRPAYDSPSRPNEARSSSK